MTNPNHHKLLVVDDEVEICNFVRMFFEHRGFTVLSANDGSEAIGVAKNEKPDIILLDVNMSETGDGLMSLPEILKNSPDSKVIMTTGVNDDASIAEAKSQGAVGYLTKPLVLEELKAEVNRLVTTE